MTARVELAVVPSKLSVRARELREGAGRDGHGQHRVGHEEDCPRETVEHQRAAAAAGVGQHDHHRHRGVLRDQRGDAGGGQRADPHADPGREAQPWPQPQTQPGGGDQWGEDQGRHPGGGPGGQHDPGQRGHRPGQVLVAAPGHAEPEVGANDDQAGQHRRQRGRDELAVRLQDAVEHYGQAVEQDLRREYHQHPRGERHHVRPRAPGRPAEQQRHQRPRDDRDHHADRDKQQHGPAEQRGGGLPHLLAVCGHASGGG